jgi:PST family polysaccharide transporter
MGVILRILGFPFSHAIMAKEKSGLYIIVQAVYWLSDFLFLILFTQIWGFNGLGFNYFIAYIIYFFLTWYVSIKLFDFKPSALLKKVTITIYLFIALAFLCNFLLFPYNYIFGSLLFVINLIWIIKTLKKDMNINILKKIKIKK